MLVLTRRKAQTIVIGDEIKLTILSITGGQVKVGIEAPENISIHRLEIYEKIKIKGEDLLSGNYYDSRFNK